VTHPATSGWRLGAGITLAAPPILTARPISNQHPSSPRALMQRFLAPASQAVGGATAFAGDLVQVVGFGGSGSVRRLGRWWRGRSRRRCQ
jgi:hypothetical protein